MLRSIVLRSTGSKAAALGGIFLLLLLGACNEEQKQVSTTPAVQEQTVEPATLDRAKVAAGETVEKAKVKVDETKVVVEKTVDGAAKQGAEAVEKSKQTFAQTSAATKESVSNAASKGAENTKAATTSAKDKTNQLVVTSTQKVNETSTGLQEEAKLATTQKVSTAAASVTPADNIILENKFGRVTLTHTFHGETYGCTPCHGDTTPGPFELTKDLAHSSMCKDCHKSAGGPTGCTDCHIK
ncbi:MAG: hypothetical protein RBR06_11740 [Desulfuromonadaceae bacterium]|nr:hypothetical protein [Desulfuromonadaceae bacterium]